MDETYLILSSDLLSALNYMRNKIFLTRYKREVIVTCANLDVHWIN